MFKSRDECLAYFRPEVLYQELSTAILIVIGVVVVCIALIQFLRGKLEGGAGLAGLILLGGAFIVVPNTRALPSLGFFTGADEATAQQFEISRREYCIAATGEIEADDGGTQEVTLLPPSSSQPLALQELAETGLVWIFYAPSRKADADRLAAALDQLKIPHDGGADTFSGVKNPKPEGVTRIVFEQQFADAAQALGEIAATERMEPVVVEGPYTLARKPIQFQLF